MRVHLLDRLDAVHARLHRWRWRVRAAAALVLVPYVVHFLYVRIVSKPALPSGTAWLDPILRKPEPAADRTVDLLAAIAAIPPLPGPSNPPAAPEGWQWGYQFDHASTAHVEYRGHKYVLGVDPNSVQSVSSSTLLRGNWSPSERYPLGRMVAYLDTPEVREALDKVVRLSGLPFCLPESADPPFPIQQLKDTACLLAGRARCRMARGDFDGAAGDLEAVLQLAAGVEDDGTARRLLEGSRTRGVALQEIFHWCREFDMTRAQMRGLARLVREHAAAFPALWKQAIRTEHLQLLRELDECCTRDQAGNGWYVPYHADRWRTYEPAGLVFNVLSVFLNDRRALIGKIDLLIRQAEVVTELPYARACEMLTPGPQRNPADGTSLDYYYYCPSAAYAQYAQNIVAQEAVPIALALSCYRKEHGQCPKGLDVLVPEYLESIPSGLIFQQRFCYRVDEDLGMVLYSVGANGKDDGGAIEDQSWYDSQQGWSGGDQDWVFLRPRLLTYGEAVLLPATLQAKNTQGEN